MTARTRHVLPATLLAALVISQEYGCTLRSDDPENDRIFASMRNLAAHVAAHREK